ncbi:MAG: hypothetical protein ABL970_18885, partial [Nitrospira sp.]
MGPASRTQYVFPLLVLALALPLSLTNAQTLELDSDVSVWIEGGQAVATSPLSGRREIPLDVQEIVVGSGAKGINAIVVTSRRLLGFSSRTLAWSGIARDVREKIVERRMMPTFSLVRTDTHIYG